MFGVFILRFDVINAFLFAQYISAYYLYPALVKPNNLPQVYFDQHQIVPVVADICISVTAIFITTIQELFKAGQKYTCGRILLFSFSVVTDQI